MQGSPVLRRRVMHATALLTIATVFLIQGCCLHHRDIFKPCTIPQFVDDGDPTSLRKTLARQRQYLGGLPSDTIVKIGGTPYSTAMLSGSISSLEDFLALKPQGSEIDRFVRDNFTVYQAGGRRGGWRAEMLVTGYYEPVLEGRLDPSPPYIYPLYSPPPDLMEQVQSSGKKVIGRIGEDGVFRPYWTREEIENRNLLKGSELVYLRDRFDAFLLHIQGSGKIRLADGTMRSLHYRANNGHSYSSIGRLLADEKKMDLEDVSTDAIRKYLNGHPQEVTRILHHNRRFIFFGWGEGDNPVGSIGQELTPGRSIAIDKDILPMGVIGYLITQKPVMDEDGRISHWVPLRRFVVPQDTGSAIKGPGRVDLFWGNGSYAEAAAGTMKEKGYLYFLVQKDSGNAND